MKKIITILLCIAFAFAIVSCAATEEEVVPEYQSGISGDVDYQGKTFVYGMVKDYFFEGEDSTLGYINTTEFADLAAQRLKDVEDKFNCIIDFKYVTRAGEAAFYSVSAGDIFR